MAAPQIMPAMLSRTQQSFFKMRKGNIVKVIKEVYLRDDIECGSSFCTVCCKKQVLERNAPCYIVPDTNVCLHQIDALESPAIRNIIFLSVVLDEVRNQNRATFARIKRICEDPTRAVYFFANEFHKLTYITRDLNESINDRNDRAIRTAVEWYSRHLSAEGAPPVVMVTHDQQNKIKALQMGLQVMTLRDYVQQYLSGDADVMDKISTVDDPETAGTDRAKYRKHLTREEVQAGLVKGSILQGKLFANRFNYREATVKVFNDANSASSSGHQFSEVLISGLSDLNRSIDGDVVAIEMLPPSQWKRKSRRIVQDEANDAEAELAANETAEGGTAGQLANTISAALARGFLPSGRVVSVLKPGRREFCGVLLIRENQSLAGSMKLLFVPNAKRIPRIRISTKQASLLKDKRLVVVIDEWPENSPYPVGHYTQILGPVGDRETEAKVVLIENDIPFYEFPPEVLACLPQDDWKITPEEVAKRWDLRDRDVCSVDPPGCKDIDDALHCMELPNGNFEVGVHIADVTHFLHEGTAMDLEAQKRATSVYLVDRRIDMLPKLLTEILCSLRGNEESLSFSVVWEMTPEAKIVSEKFAKTVILSRAALSYQVAYNRINDTSLNDPVTKGLRHLMMLSKILKQGRLDAGALELASQEMKVKLDSATGDVLSVAQYESFPTCSMIEEFMLLANVRVAARIYEQFPTHAFLRRHPAPSETMFDGLQEAIKTRGLPALDLSSGGALAKSLTKCVDPHDPFINTLIRMLTTRCLQQAKYFCSGYYQYNEFYHYGLASTIYTHFTSPIRRYADDIVHRQLAACLGIITLSEQMTDKEKLHELADNINYRHTAAQYAGRDSTNLHTGFFFKGKVERCEAYVIFKRDNGVAVFVPKFGIESVIWTTGDPSSGGSRTMNLSGADLKRLKVFDKVNVEITIRTDDSSRNNLEVKLTSVCGDESLKRPRVEEEPAEGMSAPCAKRSKID